MKKRNHHITRKIITDSRPIEYEQGFIKPKGKPVVPAVTNRGPVADRRSSVELDYDLAKKIKREQGSNYHTVHTHPASDVTAQSQGLISALPSVPDIIQFLTNDSEDSATIIQRNTNNGRIQGSFTIKKTKKTPLYGAELHNKLTWPWFLSVLPNPLRMVKMMKIQFDAMDYKKRLDEYESTHLTWREFDYREAARVALEPLCEKYGLRYRFSMKNSEVLINERFKRTASMKDESVLENEETTKKLKLKQLKSSLEGRVATALVVGSFIFSLLFATNSLTGYTLAGANPVSPNQFGVLFFIIGLAGVFILLKNKF